ncbi:MAG: PadR family transcriptional regulator [Clostridia bacterium]
MDTPNTELIRKRVDTIILNVLWEQDRYGYEILELISSKTKGKYVIKQPTLYSCLKRLEKQGFISSYYGDESHGGRRRYYKLTQKGIDILNQDQKEWEFSRTILDNLLSDKQVDLATVEPPFDPNELRPITKRVKAYDLDEPHKTAPVIIPITVEARVVDKGQPKYFNSLEDTTVKSEVSPLSSNAKPLNFEPQKSPETYKEVSETTLIKSEESLKNEQEARATVEKVSAAEEYRLKEQRIAAEKLLRIGDFTNPISNSNVTEIIDSPHAPEPPRYKSLDEVFQEKTAPETAPPRGYKETLGAIFSVAETDNDDVAHEESEPFVTEPIRARQFNDLRQTLAEEGYKLRTYSKANTSNYYHMNYIYFNRIIRDTFLIIYLFVLVELLAVFLAKNTFEYSFKTIIIMASVALVVPILAITVWGINPTKRVKARFNFNSSIINAIIAFIAIVAISSIIGILTPSLKLELTNPRLYMPCILAFNIPLAVMVYYILYKSKNYHLKT